MSTLSNKLVAACMVTAISMVMYGCGGGGSSSSDAMTPTNGGGMDMCPTGQVGTPPDCMDPPPPGPTAEELAAEAELVANAIGPGTTRADADTTSPNDIDRIVTVADGATMPVFAGDDDGTDMLADFEDSGDAVASIMGWTGAEYTRTRGMVTDTVVKYNDKQPNTAADYLEYFGQADRPGVTGTAVAETGVLSLAGDTSMTHELISINFGITAPHQTIPITHDDPDTTEVEESSSYTGMFSGVSGTFTCSDTCSVTSDDMGNLMTLTGTWEFRPSGSDDGNANAMELADLEVAGVVPDPDFMVFGYWLQATEDEDGDVTYAVGQIDAGNNLYGNVGSIEGTARYAGPATGLYMTKTFDPNDGSPQPQVSGQFTANAMLTAHFGGTGVAADDQFTVSGTVGDFTDAEGNMIDSNWTLMLMKTARDDDGDFDGTTSGGMGTDAGAYTGQFHGDPGDDAAMSRPSSVSGSFDGHFDNGHVLGAFGAPIVPSN